MKDSILYIYPNYSTFIKKDIDFLSKKYIVKTPKHEFGNNKSIIFSFYHQLIFLLRNIFSAKVIFVMFGGYWSFFPALLGKLFNKPCFIILGGADCVSFPSINYGSLRKPLIKRFIKWSYQLCTKLIPVDESLVFNNYSYFEGSTYKHQGYKAFFPNIKTPYQVIYNGFDSNLFSTNSQLKKNNSFIVVASIPDMIRFKLKGIDIILELAKTYSDCSFTVVGISENVIKQIGVIPKNVTLYPLLSSEKFKDYLSESEFVLQLSISEGFPNALCEAMLCNCIPIGSNVGAIPTIIKDTGYIIKSSSIEKIKLEFNDIINTPANEKQMLATKARERIVEYFSILKREEAFYDLIENKSSTNKVIVD